MLDWLKKTWILLAIIVAGLIIFGDAAQLAVVIFNLSAVALVLLLADFILTSREKWGLFPTLNLDAVISSASSTPVSAALLFIGIVVLLVTILFLAVPSVRAAEIPARAVSLLPVLSKSMDATWPAAPLRHIPAGQVEQESAWKEKATLSTSRELGRGLVQMTIAYGKDGRERFNIYRDAVRYRQLQGWDWQRDPYNVRYQLTFLTLQDKANFQQVRPYFVDDAEAWKGALVCYNAGTGRWLQRRANARRLGIPSDRWNGGLDRAYTKGESAILYGRPLWQAVNEYPRVVFKRAEKYKGMV